MLFGQRSSGHRLFPTTLLAGAAILLPASPARAQTPITPRPQAPPAQTQLDSTRRLTEALLRDYPKFRLIGPANTSGRVTALAVPDTPGHKTAFVAFASGGVWKTTNAFTTSSSMSDDIGFASIGDLAIAQSDAKVIWAGTGERNSLRSNGWGDGVYKSVDGGKTWKNTGLAETMEIGRIAIHPRDANIVYVAALGHLWGVNSSRGVYKTVDGGATWQKVLFVDDTTGFVDLKMDPSNPEVLYAAGWHRLRRGGGTMEGAGAGSGIWKTVDGGRTWKRLTDPSLKNGLPAEAMGRIGLAIYPKNPRIVYTVIQVARSATDQGMSALGGVFRSDDAGATWTRTNDVSAVPDYYYNEIWVDPNDDRHVWLAGINVLASRDGGRTFESMDLGRVHSDHHALWIDPDDSQHMLLGNDGGLHATFDGGENWIHYSHPVGQFYQVEIDSTKVPYHVCGGLQDNGVWCGPSRTRERAGITNYDWYAVYGGDGFYSAVAVDSPQIRFAESQFGDVSRWNVDEWKYVRIQPLAEDAGVEAGFPFRWDWDTPFVISHFDPHVLYLGGNFLFRMPDRARRWEILGPDMTRANRANPEPDTGYTSYHSLHSIAESPLDGKVLWTGANDGLIWVTQDGGRTWRNVTNNIPDIAPRRCFVAEIEASRVNTQTAYAVYDCHQRDDYHAYVYRTTDAGQTWLRISGNLPDDAGGYVIREDPSNPRLLFIGNERGLYVSTAGGNQWQRLKNNLPTAAIRDMDIALREHELVVGTYGRSIYILDIAPLEQLTDSVLNATAAVFDVKPVRQFNYRNTYESYGAQFFHADNPSYGAQITYYLKNDIGKDAALTVRRVSEPAPQPKRAPTAVAARTQPRAQPNPRERDEGQTTTAPLPPAGSPPAAADSADDVIQTLTGSGRPGLHTLTWDLTSKKERPRELGGPTSREELREVLPGRYSVTLKVGDQTFTRVFEVIQGWEEKTPGRIR